MNVGELRAALEELPADATVEVETPRQLLPIFEVSHINGGLGLVVIRTEA